eukprot:823773-Pyramimonas_sp.AAC.1
MSPSSFARRRRTAVRSLHMARISQLTATRTSDARGPPCTAQRTDAAGRGKAAGRCGAARSLPPPHHSSLSSSSSSSPSSPHPHVMMQGSALQRDRCAGCGLAPAFRR